MDSHHIIQRLYLRRQMKWRVSLDNLPLVSIVIPTRERKRELLRLLDSIFKSDFPLEKLEVIIVDDASKVDIAQDVRLRFPSVKVIRNSERQMLAGSRNVGVLNSRGSFIFFIDDDNVIEPDTIQKLLRWSSSHDRVGVVVPMTFFYSNPSRMWHTLYSDPLLSPLVRKHLKSPPYKPIQFPYFHNAFMIPRKVINEIGLFDSKNFPIHLSECEFCLRLKKKGYKIILVPDAKVYHDVPQYSVRARAMDYKRVRYLLRNRVALAKRRGVFFLLGFSFFILPLLLVYHLYVASVNHNIYYFLTLLKGLPEGFRV